MRIDGITSCVSQLYAGYLARSLPIWADTLDSLTIVTAPNDPVLSVAAGRANVHVVQTTAFTDYGAYFNKGAALNLAYAAADPSAWVLHFDADIVPPRDWRAVAESVIEPGNMYGATRGGRQMLRHGKLWPIGFFQLWHAADRCSWRWPLFQTHHRHAGAYDVEFAEQWGAEHWQRLAFVVHHLSRPRRNWFGAANSRLMREYRKLNYPLEIPSPRYRWNLVGESEWTQDALRLCRQFGLYVAHAVCRAESDAPGYENISAPLAELAARLFAASVAV